jgi:hypothetical protein
MQIAILYTKVNTMKKYLIALGIGIGLFTVQSSAQYMIMRPGIRYGYSPRPYNRYPQQRNYSSFTPYVSVSLGYGFPNLDKNNLLSPSYDTYQGSISQTGPFMGSIDYHFSRFTSIGLMVTEGTVSAPYYNYSNNSEVVSDKLNNWSFMVNLMNYFPTGENSSVQPYLRTAIGVNSWTETITPQDNYGTPTDLAYQISFGANFKISPQSAFFVEAGYGKYILSAGLNFKL